jgi:hypothetical protein
VNNWASTKISLGAQNAFFAFGRTRREQPVETRKKKRRSGEWIDAFAFFYCPDAVLAKTVLVSRRSRAAVRGICFSAD